MDKPLIKIIIGLVIISLVIFLVGMMLFRTVLSGYYYGFFPVLILIFLLINSGFFIFFYKSLRKSPNQFIRNFMVSTGAKIMLYFILALAYILTSPKTALTFAISLLTAYITFTAYDLFVMLSLLKHRKEIHNLPEKLSN